MNLSDYLAAYINLTTKGEGETDYNCAIRCITQYFDLQTINMLCDAEGISLKLNKRAKVAKLIECAFTFDADGAMLSQSTVPTIVSGIVPGVR